MKNVKQASKLRTHSVYDLNFWELITFVVGFQITRYVNREIKFKKFNLVTSKSPYRSHFVKVLFEMIRTAILFEVLFINSTFASTKCLPNNDTNYIVCSNIGSILELSIEMQPSWTNIKIVNDPEAIFSNAEHTFGVLHMVKNLDLSQSGILKMFDGGFRDFTCLKSLNLSGTQTDVIKKNWFSQLDSLQSLDISRNWIRSLNDSELDSLSELKTLNAAHNAIENFHIYDEELTELEFLNLSSNLLKDIDLGQILKLKTLDLSSNLITTIPSDAFNTMPALDTLDIAGNYVKEIANRVFEPLNSLKVLNLSANSMEELTRFAFAGMSKKRLHVLDLSENDILSITPGSFDELTRLKNLNLSQNNIEKFSDTTFEGLPSLIRLDLGYNNIYEIPDNLFQPLRLLEYLDLSGNWIQSLSHKIFGTSGVQLKEINLADNNIVSFPGNFFQNTPNILHLSLSSNKITALDSNLFRYLTKLSILNLSENAIEEIPPNIIGDLGAITELFIDHNDMRFFPEINYNNFPQLVKFSIEANPWQCPCLEELTQFLMARHIQFGGKENYEGQKYDCVINKSNKCIRRAIFAWNEDIDVRNRPYR